MSRGLILSAPGSGSGKTTVTLGVLRALSNRGQPVRGAKSGPDYIDPRFHAAACGQPCPNLDAWAMSPPRVRDLAAGTGLLMIEGAMGLFDGAPPKGRGATADLARILQLPVILVVDCARMAHSIAPLIAGFANFDPAVKVAGVILNHVGSPRHETMLRAALAPSGLPVIGALPRLGKIEQPSRHLGLVQAEEHVDLDAYLDEVAGHVEAHLDLDLLCSLASEMTPADAAPKLVPPAQRIAVAQDRAFAFAYPHILADWRGAGAEVSFFSPLANEAPEKTDFIFLPGGYPELHAGHLAANTRFLNALREAAETTMIYGECGGYMLLGDGLEDAQGVRHAMAGLLPLETSFARRKLHLGYRHIQCRSGPFKGRWNAHEFHYASTLRAEGEPLFKAQDAEGNDLADMGLQQGKTCGSFAHLIDQATNIAE
jgi:cobyrinic acid a,c-diamide synthase